MTVPSLVQESTSCSELWAEDRPVSSIIILVLLPHAVPGTQPRDRVSKRTSE